jgi:Uma2 family endonuclease
MLDSISSRPRFTYGDYVRWQGDERWELVAGEAHLMSPAPSRRHQEVVVGLLEQIARTLRDSRCRVYVAPFDVRLPRGAEDDADIDTVVQPDLAVICDETKLDEAGCRGAPDWILEVLSPATAARDRVQKRDLYERHGVREYWLVDPDGATWTAYRLDPASGRFAAREEGKAEGTAHPAILPTVVIEWARVFQN